MSTAAVTSNRFRYGLQPLLRKRSSELDRAREGLAAATQQLEARERELQEQVLLVQQLQDYQRDLSKVDISIDVDAQLRLYECLCSAVAQKEQRALQLDQARKHHETVIDQVRVAQQALKALERHREHAAQQYQTEQVRRNHGASDELHLATRRTGTPGRLSLQAGSDH
jgi:hypothetical protein